MGTLHFLSTPNFLLVALDRMKVPGYLNNYTDPECHNRLISRASEVLDALLFRAGTTPRNYIINEANVYKELRKRDLGIFNLFKKIAVVAFPSPEKVDARFMKRRGESWVTNVMLANYVSPVSKDMPGSDELFDEVMFVELNREESQRRLDEMKEEVSNLNSNSSSPYSCRNCV